MKEKTKLRTKKIYALLTAALLAVSAAATGCAGKSKPKVTLIVKTPALNMNCVSNPDIKASNDLLEYAAKKFTDSYDYADVTINVEVFDYVDENMAILDCYGTDDAADILYEGYFNMAAYIYTGYVVPLDDIITDEIRNDIRSSAWEQSKVNGKTYMMPYLSLQNILIYNKTLFRECGLDSFLTDRAEIQNWTVDEWETILDTLADKLPDGSYPLMMYGENNQGDTHIMSFMHIFGGTVFDAEGKFDFECEETVRALKWLQDGVDRGWYAPHPENIEIIDNQQLFQSGRLALYIFNNANYIIYDDIEENYGFVNFPGNIATSFITGFQVLDNGDKEKIKVSKDFIKFIYEDPEIMEMSAGNIPESKTVTEKYADEIFMLPEFSANAANVIDFMHNSPNWQGSDNSVRSVFWPHIHDLLSGAVTPEECAAALNRDCNAAVSVETKLHE